MAFFELIVVAGGGNERRPLLVSAGGRIKHELQVDIDETGDVLGALDVAAHPVNGIGDAAEHYKGLPWV